MKEEGCLEVVDSWTGVMKEVGVLFLPILFLFIQTYGPFP